MNYIAYTARFLYRIKWWMILAPIIVALAVFFKMGAQPRNYKSMTTVYTGIVSGYDITTTEGTRQDWNIINNAMDNMINIILSQTTLKNVSMRLYAQGLTHLDPDNDNQYLTARTSRYLLNRTPKEVMDLVDRTSEEKTLENLRRFEEADHDNHVYGMFHWNPPYYSYQALSQIKVKRITSSDMLEISYENDDPYIVYNTLVILNDEFVRQYRDLRFGETNNVIAYFESELARVGKNLRELEDSLRDYNVEHKVINYDEQTKHIAALSRDYELRYEEIPLNFESAEKLRKSIEEQLEGLPDLPQQCAVHREAPYDRQSLLAHFGGRSFPAYAHRERRDALRPSEHSGQSQQYGRPAQETGRGDPQPAGDNDQHRQPAVHQRGAFDQLDRGGVARRRTARREIAGRAGGHETAQDRTR